MFWETASGMNLNRLWEWKRYLRVALINNHFIGEKKKKPFKSWHYTDKSLGLHYSKISSCPLVQSEKPLKHFNSRQAFKLTIVQVWIKLRNFEVQHLKFRRSITLIEIQRNGSKYVTLESTLLLNAAKLLSKERKLERNRPEFISCHKKSDVNMNLSRSSATAAPANRSADPPSRLILTGWELWSGSDLVVLQGEWRKKKM